MFLRTHTSKPTTVRCGMSDVLRTVLPRGPIRSDAVKQSACFYTFDCATWPFLSVIIYDSHYPDHFRSAFALSSIIRPWHVVF